MEEEAKETQSAVRIFVGGLGEAVSDEDLRTLFSSLGTVQTIRTIRTKGRSFAYLDFLTDPKSLSKLFSKYNGCLWKGGRLKLEKAKEDYLTRLKREWEQEALADATQPPPVVPQEVPKSLSVFFPRLRKVKSIPFNGTGKHKYSFQNIKVPPLPVHFCDCEEHCSPFVNEREKQSIDGAAESGGMNDEEINIMNAVMNKLFEKEKVSNAKNLGEEKDSFESPDALHSDECEDSATDEDDLIINMQTRKNKTALIGNQELEKILENQEWSNKTKVDKEEPNKSTPQVQKRNNSNPAKNKKRKSLPKLEVSTTSGGKSNMQTLSDEEGSDAQPTELEDDVEELTKVSWSQKSSWRELLGDGGNTSFSASLILPELDSGKNQQSSEHLSTSISTDSETENMESDGHLWSKSTNTQVIKELAEVQPTNEQVIKELAEAQPANKQVIEDLNEMQNNNNVVPNKTGRGASWRRKQSWTQLVSENNSSFSISHILPGITFPEPMAKEPIMEPAISNDCKHNDVAQDTIDKVLSDGFNSREIIPERIQHIGANDIVPGSVAEEKVETSPRERSIENVEVGETCRFMRSAASLKDWAKAKAAISRSLKRKRGVKYDHKFP
ncbi:uncharacterized protein LOC109815529 [Cajanus cajan]|uniref:Nucleolar protein 8 n=1 Tax=Cajanus cajan TaxID=3821 RepID=A0A151RVC0_CAJCA|nr:uncharacterized protein LOC109815529 [Cajanus cajan]KYP46495.1 Nucleolar protein 8 [Cajanus cajan]